jgi:hypothetical protein
MSPSNNKRPKVSVFSSGVLKTYEPDLVAVRPISGKNKQKHYKGELKMITRVGKLACLSVVWGMALSLILIQAPALCFGGEIIDIDIDVTPNVLNIQSEGQVVTVHTDIYYSVVEGHTVLLNGVAIYSWKADNCGNFVAKFLMESIKELLAEEEFDDYYTLNLILAGVTKDDEPFSGTQDIKVIDVIPQAPQGQ